MHKDDSRDGDENDAAGQNEQDGGRHSDLGLADLFVFLLWKNKQAMPLEQIQANYKRASKYSELTKGPKADKNWHSVKQIVYVYICHWKW